MEDGRREGALPEAELVTGSQLAFSSLLPVSSRLYFDFTAFFCPFGVGTPRPEHNSDIIRMIMARGLRIPGRR